MLQYIRERADPARRKVQEIIARPTSQALDLTSVLALDWQQTDPNYSQRDKPEASQTRQRGGYENPMELHRHSIYNCLNQQCCERKSLVLLAFDPGHPFGNAIIVEHDWTDAEVVNFRNRRVLPIQLYSGASVTKRCVVLRFLDDFRQDRSSLLSPSVLRVKLGDWL